MACQYCFSSAIVRTAHLDRLEVFDQLAEPAESSWRLAGLMSDDRMSIGLYPSVLVAVAYLIEKYLLAWFRMPFALVPGNSLLAGGCASEYQ